MTATKNSPKPQSGSSVRRLLQLFYALPVLLVLALCSYVAYVKVSHKVPPVRKISSAPFASVKIGDLDAHLFAQGDSLRAAGNDVFIEFRDNQGKLTDVGEVEFDLVLKMPAAVMHSIGKVLRTATPGQYRTTVEPGMVGDWTATLHFSGLHGTGETNLLIKVI
jgi:hypothetical protein